MMLQPDWKGLGVGSTGFQWKLCRSLGALGRRFLPYLRNQGDDVHKNRVVSRPVGRFRSLSGPLSWSCNGRGGGQLEDGVSPRRLCINYSGGSYKPLSSTGLTLPQAYDAAFGPCRWKAGDTGRAGIDPFSACLWLD